MKFSTKLFAATSLLLVTCSLILSGCGVKQMSDSADPSSGVALSGTVSTDGSTSMEKVIGILGEAFAEKNSKVTFTYNPTGSGSGIRAVKDGRCDIGLSSRVLKDEEKADNLVETVLALDGISLIVHPDNTAADLSLEAIAAIYTGEITNWQEVGGTDAQIVLVGREAGSGTRDGFESVTKTKDNCKYRQELTSTGDVIASVSGNPNAIGYASYASVRDNVKVLSVNNVFPSEETIRDGSYVIQRPYILVTRQDAPLSEAAQEFFNFATSSEVSELISSTGAVAVN